MVGYAINGCRLQIQKTNEILIIRDVTFDENNCL